MSYLLFLYPVKPYFDAEISARKWSYEQKGKSMERALLLFNQYIFEQYRLKDYSVAWACFGQEHNRTLPNTTNLTEHVTFFDSDYYLSAGMTWEEMNNQQNKYFVYPDPENLFRQIAKKPRGSNKIVLAGFHEDDCVAKTFQCGEKLGWDMYLDANITERFFAYAGQGFFDHMKVKYDFPKKQCLAHA